MRGEGVLAGTACATEVFAQLDPTVQVDWLVDDGGLAGAGAKIGAVSGSLRSVLTGERTALNFLCHLSGVATATHRFVPRPATRCGCSTPARRCPACVRSRRPRCAPAAE